MIKNTCKISDSPPLPPGMVCEIYYNTRQAEEFRFTPDHTPITEKIVGPLFIGIGVAIFIVIICISLASV